MIENTLSYDRVISIWISGILYKICFIEGLGKKKISVEQNIQVEDVMIKDEI